MHKFPIYEYRKFEELPLDKLNALKFSVYLLDFNWNYMFINDFVKSNIKERANDLIGKNIWEEFPELLHDTPFAMMREKMERKIPYNFETTSPVTRQRLSITSFPLEDCYYFTASILPDKQELLNEIRNELRKKLD